MMPTPVRKVSFSFSPSGTHMACLLVCESGRLDVQTLALERGVRRTHRLSRHSGLSNTQLVCLDDGRILVTRPGVLGHEVVLIGTDSGTEVTVAVVQSPGFRLVASPDPAVLAVGVAVDGPESCRLIRIDTSNTEEIPVPGLTGPLSGGHWLDSRGRLLAFNRAGENGTRPVVVDLDKGEIADVTGCDTGSWHLLQGSAAKRVLLANDNSGSLRLAWSSADSTASPIIANALHSTGGALTPLALDDTGRRLALKLSRGARSHLLVYRLDEDSMQEVAVPAGNLEHVAKWSQDRLRLIFSAPDQPADAVTVDFGQNEEGRWVGATSQDHPGWQGAHLEELDGPAGPIEAIVYGGADWRESRQLLIALHGGPDSAWRLTFDPLFQHLASAGIAVVAPNQRGSVGYGAGHREAIRHAWGGPDLDDILHIGRTITGHRQRAGIDEPLMLFGESYGAFLALLASAVEPCMWARCVAVAPFLSAARLERDSNAGVGKLLRRLGGLTEIQDDIGPRDLERLYLRIRARLLIVHGECDQTVPVTHARELYRLLRASGRRPGPELAYLEVRGAGHDPVTESQADVRKAITDFLAGKDSHRHVAVPAIADRISMRKGGERNAV